MAKNWIVLGCILGFLSVAMGAFGAHALENRIDERMLSIFKTAAQYQMYHAVALVLVGLWAIQTQSSGALPGWCFTLGILLFSGSLYALTLTGVKILGAITPFGGLLFMLGWLSFAVLAWRR